MKRCIMLSLVLTIAVFGCSMMGNRGGQTLVGTWIGVLPQGIDLTLTFKDNMTIQASGMASYSAKYTVDYSKNPATLDVFDNSNIEIGNVRYLGIIKFVDNNTLRICGVIETQGDRPKDFTDETIELKRK